MNKTKITTRVTGRLYIGEVAAISKTRQISNKAGSVNQKIFHNEHDEVCFATGVISEKPITEIVIKVFTEDGKECEWNYMLHKNSKINKFLKNNG